MSMVNYIVDGELYHHGIKGQRWGDRNYQYEDGSLTPEGRRRYYGSAGQNRFRFGDAKSKPKTKEEKEMAKANSAYRVERHKAKMERKTQEALNKERIKKEQSNAKRNAEIAKLKGNKPVAKIKKKDGISEDKTEDTRNNKKFDKHVKELLNNKKIKDYSKYTDEELEAAAKRKEAQNSLEAQKRAGTKIGRLEGYLKSPEGTKLLSESASHAIDGVSKIAADSARAAIATYLKENSKEMFERSVDMAGWERKRAAEISKAESEAEKASAESSSEKGRAVQEWRKAEGVEEENTRKQMEFDEQKSSRKARNKAEIAKAKQSEEASKAEISKSQLEKIKNKNAADLEKVVGASMKSGYRPDEIAKARINAEVTKAEAEAVKSQKQINKVLKQNALDQVDIQKYSIIKNSEAASESQAFDRFINSLSKEELFAYINANKK